MRDEIKDLIDQELDEKEQNLAEIYEPMQDEINKLVEEQNKKLMEEHQKGIDEINKKYNNGNLTGEELVKMQEEAMQEAMKYLNREDN